MSAAIGSASRCLGEIGTEFREAVRQVKKKTKKQKEEKKYQAGLFSSPTTRQADEDNEQQTMGAKVMMMMMMTMKQEKKKKNTDRLTIQKISNRRSDQWLSAEKRKSPLTIVS
ncbi:hypothetical protein T4E_12318 [Trichinella pseudospiralis]|uniref:Uncharacterized protein n=1 Tax=Trichinella pseudospiralis TaxID=6337 RepID=A0A0V0XYQ5_TRIPS|nr:hypothetical protein T4E_3327 [Trichinella pseudospiralis]KRX93206.1 hypothetical protein T4E_12318 [Trichinella pseudospiralis]